MAAIEKAPNKAPALSPGGGRLGSYVRDVLATYLDAWVAQRDVALSVDPYLRGEHPLPIASQSQTKTELEQLRTLAFTPYARLILNSSIQALNIKGVRVEGADDQPEAWKKFWIRNGMEARQLARWRAAVGYGHGYSSVLPGELGLKGEEGLVVRHYTPKTMTAFYADSFDPYPAIALNGIEQTDERGQVYWLFEIFDDTYVHFAYVRDLILAAPSRGMKVEYLESRPHGAPVTPITYHTPLMDDDGGSRGEIVPFLPIIARLDQSVYDRLLIQRQAAWKVRTATGLKKPQGSTAQANLQATLKAGDLLTSDSPDTTFGTLEASSMAEHLTTRDSDLRDLATSSQTPSWMLTGESSNLSSEAMSAITSGYQQKIETYKRSLGLSSRREFELVGAMDPSLSVEEGELEIRWAEFRPYSLTQISDSLGKLSQQLEVDPTLLYEFIPFFSDEDVERAAQKRQEMKDEALAMAEAEAAAAQANAPAPGGGSPDAKRSRGSAGDSGQNPRS